MRGDKGDRAQWRPIEESVNATVKRRPGSATVSGVKFAPTLVPTALSSRASSEASGSED